MRPVGNAFLFVLGAFLVAISLWLPDKAVMWHASFRWFSDSPRRMRRLGVVTGCVFMVIGGFIIVTNL